jgi:SAM-dependent methyltransferase
LLENTQLTDEQALHPPRVGGQRVQFGCGPGPVPRDWINFDASPTVRISRVPLIGKLLTRGRVEFDKQTKFGDVVKGLPIENGSCDAVYSSHVLEHLPRADVRVALDNTLRILRPGGVFRVVLPDLRFMSTEYLERRLSADQFVTELHMGMANGGRRQRLFDALGNSRHLWMWDETSLSELLGAAGYVHVRRAVFGDRRDELFAGVECEDRWRNCLGLQAERAK